MESDHAEDGRRAGGAWSARPGGLREPDTPYPTDKVIPPQVAAGVHGIPGAKLVRYPDAGRVPMEQIPDRSAADVKVFVQGLPA